VTTVSSYGSSSTVLSLSQSPYCQVISRHIALTGHSDSSEVSLPRLRHLPVFDLKPNENSRTRGSWFDIIHDRNSACGSLKQISSLQRLHRPHHRPRHRPHHRPRHRPRHLHPRWRPLPEWKKMESGEVRVVPVLSVCRLLHPGLVVPHILKTHPSPLIDPSEGPSVSHR